MAADNARPIDKTIVEGTKSGPKDVFVWDGGKAAIPGFGLKVTPTGKKVFIFQYRLRGKTAPVRMTIGTYGAWTPHQAREHAKTLRARVDLGGDPAGEIRSNRALAIEAEAAKAETDRIAAESTVRAIAERFLASVEKQGGHRFYKSALNQHVLPVIGDMPIAEVASKDIRRMIGKVDDSKSALPRAVFMAARAVWKFNRLEREMGRGFECGNPFADMIAPKAVESRDRVLSDSEIKLLWAAAEKQGYPFGEMYRLLLVTAARRDEVAAMAWSELDRSEKVWRIPAGRTKNGMGHELPLSPLALEILDGIARRSIEGEPEKLSWPVSGFVLSTRSDTAISGFSKAKARLDEAMQSALIEEAGEGAKLTPWRVHDLRRTVATRLQRLNVRFEVTEAVLNHVSGSRAGVAGVYQRYGWNDEKRTALDAWANHLEVIIGRKRTDNVVEIEAAKRA